MLGREGEVLDTPEGMAGAAAAVLTAGVALFTLEGAVVTTFSVGTCSRLWPTALSLAVVGAAGVSASAEALSDSQA